MAACLVRSALPLSGRPSKKNTYKSWPSLMNTWLGLLQLLILAITINAPFANAAFVKFRNCLPQKVIDSNPKILQFVPLFVDAKFNITDDFNGLNITVYGNVTGQTFQGSLPPIDSPDWLDPTKSNGKIIDVDPTTNILTTLFVGMKALSYEAWKPDHGFRFCEQVVNQACPLTPAFYSNASEISELPGFSIAHNLQSTYSMTTLVSRLSVQSGQDNNDMAPYLACVIAIVTPALGSTLSTVLTVVPVIILVMVALSTILAAWLSPWSSPDIYRWSSNYGRDADVIRLVTPGFGDCLNYIQFAVLASALSLNYPGFFQPVMSRSAWSVLMFNQSLASGTHGISSIEDDIYIVNATRGLSGLRQYVGMAEDKDVWTGMITWVLTLIGIIAILSQLAISIRWLQMRISKTGDADRHNKSIPFMLGNLVRVLFSYFVLPILALTMFQFVVAPESPAVITAMAVLLFLIILAIAIWILRVISTTRPRSHLYEDLPDLLLYGPLYNTYTDEAAAFAFVPLAVTLLRAIAIGAVQPSGIAQIVLLIICEVIFLMALHVFRPYISSSSMHAHHTAVSVLRLIVVFLSIVFVPSLKVSESIKGWVGYAILLFHALILIFWYFLNALQTLLEVFARLGGAGGNTRGGLAKVFGVKELSKRSHRSVPQNSRSSTGGRSHSMTEHARNSSATSGALLQQNNGASAGRSSQGGEPSSPGVSTPGDSYSSPSLFSPGHVKQGNVHVPSVGTTASSVKANSAGGRPSYIEPLDPYYRPPRAKRMTNEFDPRRESSISRPGDNPVSQIPDTSNVISSEPERSDSDEGYAHIIPQARLGSQHLAPGGSPIHPRRNKDYSTRESDFYYGVSQRGPALSSTPTRKLKTGPADPTSSISNVTGWAMNLFTDIGQGNFPGRKKKVKGFKVVRSKPAVALMDFGDEEETAGLEHPRYRDEADVSSSTAAMLLPKHAHGHSRQSSNNATEHSHMTHPSFSGFDGQGLYPLDADEADLSYRPPGAVPAMIIGSSSGEGVIEPDTQLLGPKEPMIPRRSSKRTSSTGSSQNALSSPEREPRFGSVAVPEFSLNSTPTENYATVGSYRDRDVSTSQGGVPTVTVREAPLRKADRNRESSRVPFMGAGSMTRRSASVLSRSESFYSIPDSEPSPPPIHPNSIPQSPPEIEIAAPSKSLRPAAPTHPPSSFRTQANKNRPLSTGTVPTYIAGRSIIQSDSGTRVQSAGNDMAQSAELFNEVKLSPSEQRR